MASVAGLIAVGQANSLKEVESGLHLGAQIGAHPVGTAAGRAASGAEEIFGDFSAAEISSGDHPDEESGPHHGKATPAPVPIRAT